MTGVNMEDIPQENVQGQAVMIEQLRAQVAQLSRLITEQQQPIPQPTKKKLPDPERYDGEEKAKYPTGLLKPTWKLS